ncbi:MAG: hypothetical protein SPJ13_06500 [Bacteroidales bacterium]|nr:hypothetical protein [Bacteroidales bacterium]
MLQLQDEAFEELGDPSLLRRNSPAMLRACLCGPHFVLGAWAQEGVLAAFSVLYFPMDQADDLSLLLEGVDLAGRCAANNKLCIVHRPFRGNGLQLSLGWGLEREAYQRGVRVLCSTASPHNAASCSSLLKQGYLLNRRLRLYEGEMERNLYVKEL